MSSNATDKHIVRAVFDVKFLRELASHNDIHYDEHTGKVHGLEAGVRRLFEWRQARLKRDMDVLYPQSRPRDPPSPGPVPAKELYDMSIMKKEN
ncbi:MAG: hypothetical protein WC998_05480 [Candidatus Paceibacterota bacterium]|jgi:hypothetical protein